MGALFQSGGRDVVAVSAVDHLTLAEKSKMPTDTSLEVLLRIESGLGLKNIDPENSLFKSQKV